MQEQMLASYIDLFHRDVTFFCGETLRREGLTVGLMYFILYVYRNPGCTPIQLTKDLGLDRGYALRCIQKLAEGGFFERRPHPTDRRATVLYTTEKGTEVFFTCRDLLHRWDECMLEGITDAEKQQLFSLLEKIQRKGRTNDVQRF